MIRAGPTSDTLETEAVCESRDVPGEGEIGPGVSMTLREKPFPRPEAKAMGCGGSNAQCHRREPVRATPWGWRKRETGGGMEKEGRGGKGGGGGGGQGLLPKAGVDARHPSLGYLRLGSRSAGRSV
jgi:hypothetical protein